MKKRIQPFNVNNQEKLYLYDNGYSCTVTLNCGDGTIKCTGATGCSRSSSGRYVTCDDKTTYC